MTIYRRNTLSDKAVSFISIMLAILLIRNNIMMYQAIGTISSLDLVVTLVGILIGGLFLYTSKIKYIEVSSSQISWYTWFFVKHTLEMKQIKEVEAKTYYIILVKENDKEVWIPTRCIKKQRLNELLKALKVEQA